MMKTTYKRMEMVKELKAVIDFYMKISFEFTLLQGRPTSCWFRSVEFRKIRL